jgi:hypothetical protein
MTHGWYVARRSKDHTCPSLNPSESRATRSLHLTRTVVLRPRRLTHKKSGDMLPHGLTEQKQYCISSIRVLKGSTPTAFCVGSKTIIIFVDYQSTFSFLSFSKRSHDRLNRAAECPCSLGSKPHNTARAFERKRGTCKWCNPP